MLEFATLFICWSRGI